VLHLCVIIKYNIITSRGSITYFPSKLHQLLLLCSLSVIVYILSTDTHRQTRLKAITCFAMLLAYRVIKIDNKTSFVWNTVLHSQSAVLFWL